MIWNARRILFIPIRYRLFAVIRLLLIALLATVVLGQCLERTVRAAPVSHAAIGCHNDCWHRGPAWQPAVIVQQTRILSPPLPSLSSIVLTDSVLTVNNDFDRSPSPRSPPTALAH